VSVVGLDEPEVPEHDARADDRHAHAREHAEVGVAGHAYRVGRVVDAERGEPRVDRRVRPVLEDRAPPDVVDPVGMRAVRDHPPAAILSSAGRPSSPAMRVIVCCRVIGSRVVPGNG
jgi:hypothetical protein